MNNIDQIIFVMGNFVVLSAALCGIYFIFRIGKFVTKIFKELEES